MKMYTDFSKGYIWVQPEAPAPEKKAARVLAEEIEKRTGICLPVCGQPMKGRPFIFVGSSVPEPLARNLEGLDAPGKEGYRVWIEDGQAVAAGADVRGCFYGAGRLLRMMKWGTNVALQIKRKKIADKIQKSEDFQAAENLAFFG